MVISRDVASLSKLINQQSNEKTNSALSAEQSENKFNNYLKELLAKTEQTSFDSSSLAALSKEQLMLFTKALQIQMNSRLYNSLFSNSLESNVLASKIMQNYGAGIAHHVSDPSKYNQKTPKNNLSCSDPQLNQLVHEAAQKYDVDINLIRSVIKTESNFNASATSPRGAMGLMQLMPETARELGVKNAYDPQENIMGGTRYLKMLLTRYDGQVDMALAAYNWGMGNVEKKPDRLPAETLGYIEKVNSYYKSAKA